MISVEEALEIVLANARDFGTEHIPLDQSLDKTLREEITADRHFPPYDRVTMDGIALSFASFQAGKRKFPIEDVAAAGNSQKSLNNPDQCLEVMTGSILPIGTDTVIPYEQLSIEDGSAAVTTEDVQFRQNIHFRGSDRQKGDVIITPGIKISSSEVGVCATVGKTEVQVSRLPKAIVISTGDELVDIHERPLPHQIRKSNVFRIKTTLQQYGLKVDTAHLKDDLAEVQSRLTEFLSSYELILVSGGVSKGKFDFLPEALSHVGVEKLFHRIAQRPGKPFWFGKHPNNSVVFAFPGNPVSSFMCLHQYLLPWLEKSLRLNKKADRSATLSADVEFAPDLTYFLEVRLESSHSTGITIAHPIKGNGSGDLANLVDGDAFIKLPRGKNRFKQGETYPILLYR